MDKIISINNIDIEGFGSYINRTKISFSDKGTHIIKGHNGAGKTTQFSALYWVLYGKVLKDITAKDIPTWKHLRPETWRGTRVVLSLMVDSDEYQIARHIAFKGTTFNVTGGNALMIRKNGKEISDGLHVIDQQQYINTMLGMSSEIFLNTIMFGQRMNRLITSKDEYKRKLLEELLGIEFIKQAKELAAAKIKETSVNENNLNIELVRKQSELDSLLMKIESINSKIESWELNKKQQISIYSEHLNDTMEQISLNKEKLRDLQAKANTYSKTIDEDLQDVDNTVSKFNDNIKSIELKISSINSKNDKFDSLIASEMRNKDRELNKLANIATTCPACGGNLSDLSIEKVKNGILETIQSIDALILSYNEQRPDITHIPKHNFDLSELITKRDEYLNSVKELYNKKSELSSIKREIISINNVLIDLESKSNSYIEKIDHLNSQSPPSYDIDSLHKSIDDLNLFISENIEKLSDIKKYRESLEWWNSKAFGSSGLKAYIFNTMLNNLNNLCKKYSNRVGLNITFSVDLSKSSCPFIVSVSKNGMDVLYESLSGGEQQRVDICMAFALHDFISSSNKINILILDEVFESIDDYGGIEDIFDLISYKAGIDRSVYIITHSKSITCDYSKEIIIENSPQGSLIV